MNEADLRGILLLIIPRLVDMICKKQNLSEKEALSELYSSTLYAQLCRDETKLWHLSVPTLYSLWLSEKETGKIDYPEEA